MNIDQRKELKEFLELSNLSPKVKEILKILIKIIF